jgi:Ca2+-binding RTX toxin-like protein
MVAGALLLVLVAGVAVARTFQCNNIPCTGTNNDDIIDERQGSLRDEISGLDGRDVIRAQQFGNDNDVLDGDQRADKIRANDNDNRDTVDCGAGNDRAVVDPGDAVNFSNCERVQGQNGESPPQKMKAGPAAATPGFNEAVPVG